MPRRDDLLPPRESAPDLPDELTEHRDIRRGADLQGVRLVGLSGDVDAAHSEVRETAWESPALSALDLTGATLGDVFLDDPRIAALAGRESRWRDVEVAGGRIGSVDLLRAELDGVVFRGVRIDYLALASARVAHVRFVGCTFGTIDLPDARVDRVAFDDCRADEIDTRGMRAAHLDIRGLEVLVLTDPLSLAGVTLTPRQAEFHGPAFAAALKLRVRD